VSGIFNASSFQRTPSNVINAPEALEPLSVLKEIDFPLSFVVPFEIDPVATSIANKS
jgi:hypothetical protein